MATAKVFRSGNSQAVRLPKEFRIDADEVEITRRGEEIILRERRRDMTRLLEALDAFTECGIELPDDPPPQDRNDL